MKTAQPVTPVTTTAQPTEIASPPPVQPLDTAGQLMADSSTPECKKAAFMALFYAATNDTLNEAVDYFYENPGLFSKTVKDLCVSIKAKKLDTSLPSRDQETLKKFIEKMSDGGLRIRPFMRSRFAEAKEAETWTDYQKALKPYFALKDTFEVVKQTACPCAVAYKACDKFNAANNHFMAKNIGLMYKKIGTLDMDK